jgi:bacteriocin biosynthesis cyclodehydratase domain-containing protein
MDPLPNRPAIRPDLAVVRRGPGEVQVGTNPEHALVVADLPEAFADELLALDGRLTVTELGERVEERGEDPAKFRELLAGLDGEGLLHRPRPPANVEVHGTDLLAAAIRSLLPQHATSPDLVIVTGFPRPDLINGLMAARSPHLAVRAGEGVGVIGPLVLPGRTSCLTCADLHRTDRDHSWPAVAAQLSAKSPEQDEVLATATAAFSVTQALLTTDFLRSAGERPPTWNATIELRPALGITSQRSWYPHPDCPCAAHNMAW